MMRKVSSDDESGMDGEDVLVGKNKLIEMDIDEALEITGPCGRFQISFQILFSGLILVIGYHAVMNYFIGSDPPWTCAQNATSVFCFNNTGKIFSSDDTDFTSRCDLPRSDWVYTTDKKYSFVTEFELVCDKTAVAAFTSGVFYLGGFAGCILSGIAADMIGRKRVLIMTLGLTVISSLLCSFVSYIWQLTVLRGILGAAQMSTYAIGFVTLSEFVAPSYRTMSANMFQLTFCISQMLLDLVAFYMRKWRHLQFFTTFPSIIPFVLFFFIPESPRFLLANKRKQEAIIVLQQVGQYNRKQHRKLMLKTVDIGSTKTYTYLDLFRHRKVFALTSVVCFIWTTVAFVYYAIALESSNLGGDMYQAFGLSTLADLPANFVALYACKRFGRRKTTLISIFMSGLLIGSIALVPFHVSYRYTLNISLAMGAKFLIDLAFNGVYLWTFELFPTVLRSQGMSLSIAWERIGACASPFLTTVLQKANPNLPFIIMGGLAILCSLAGFILPETNNTPTRESYEDFFEKTGGYQVLTDPPPPEVNDSD